MKLRGNCGSTGVGDVRICSEDSKGELDDLLKLCSEVKDRDGGDFGHYSEGDGVVDAGTGGLVQCPLFGVDISNFTQQKQMKFNFLNVVLDFGLLEFYLKNLSASHFYYIDHGFGVR